ncbi:MAG: phosphoribosylglycinamide formyltransferase [Candidatus Omnitrophica bacterium]|nr:phosphoribosylglycinamide formyltransferase [Candidatus Omnitrophota bacterium]MCM8802895.1 phosphoribosylglycinamide formyltransferase [Candidatus Omnitrophota bacterium]
MFTIGILASGKGTNLQAIIDYIKEENLPIKIGIVISDNPEAYALERAKKEGIRNICIPCEKYKTILDKETEIKYIEVLKENNVELVCLAGFMRILKKNFIKNFPNKIINIHPSLLPAFPGLESWKKALEYGVRFTGCTVHFVDEGIDSGPIILQAVVPILQDDTPEILHKRIQEKEHIIYPLAIRLIAEGRVSIVGRKVYIR